MDLKAQEKKEEQHKSEDEEVEDQEEDSCFDGNEKVLKETGVKLVMQSDVVAPVNAKKSKEIYVKKIEEEEGQEGLGGEVKEKNEVKQTKKNKKAEARVIPIGSFGGEDNTTLEVPYATIELIFNTRNAYANRQHHDPAKIYYNLYDPYISMLILIEKNGIHLLIKEFHQKNHLQKKKVQI